MKTTKIALVLVSAAVLAASPEVAEAQAFVGVGGNVSMIGQRETDTGATRPGLNGRVGFGVGRGVAVVLEASLYGLGDDVPQPDDYQGGELIHRPEVLRTDAVLASVQLSLGGGLYVRPGVGLGRHAFASYLVTGSGPEEHAYDAEVSHEAGLAAGLAVGTTLQASPRLSVALEAVALFSQGEDSSAGRRVFGLQIVPLFRF